MTEQNSLVIQGGQMNLVAQSDIKVGLADVVTVAVSKAEEQIRMELRAAIAKGKDLDKRFRDASDELCAAIKEQTEQLFGEQAKAAEAFLCLFDSVQLKFDGTVKKDKDTGNHILTVSMRSGWWSYAKTVERPANERVTAAFAACETLGDEISEANQEAAEWRRKLQSVPALERRYRGQVVAAQLETTEDGKRLLEGLSADIQAAVDSL